MAALFLEDKEIETLRTLLATEAMRAESGLESWKMAHAEPSETEDELTLWLHDIRQLAKAVGDE